MPKTIAELSGLIEVLDQRVNSTRLDLDDLYGMHGKSVDDLQAIRVECVSYREGLAQARKELDELRQKDQNQERVNAELRQENALLRQRLDDYLKRVEKWDTRFWGMLVVLVGALLSLASGLIVVLVKK